MYPNHQAKVAHPNSGTLSHTGLWVSVGTKWDWQDCGQVAMPDGVTDSQVLVASHTQKDLHAQSDRWTAHTDHKQIDRCPNQPNPHTRHRKFLDTRIQKSQTHRLTHTLTYTHT